jgi:dUTP pyrophosphatase
MKETKLVPILLEEGVLPPKYATTGAAGADVRAYLKENIVLEPGKFAIVPTGISFEIPDGYEIQVRPRSGLAAKFGVTVLNSPGTIDSDYRGELKVILINHGSETFVIENEMRIAQIVLAKVEQAHFEIQEALSISVRSSSGFGSTGVR